MWCTGYTKIGTLISSYFLLKIRKFRIKVSQDILILPYLTFVLYQMADRLEKLSDQTLILYRELRLPYHVNFFRLFAIKDENQFFEPKLFPPLLFSFMKVHTVSEYQYHTPSREERHFLYFNHLSKEFLEQMIPHLKALI